MKESKIQIRARILHTISSLRSLKSVSDADIEKAIKDLSDISDKAFMCTTIIKEIEGITTYFDGILAILAMNLAKGEIEKTVFEFLTQQNVADSKKLFLINMLAQLGKPVEPGLIQAYIDNPDEAIDSETEKFLKMAEIDPEAQIDFLDFYFGIADKDKTILLDSIICDYEGDLLANILIPIIYSVTDECTLEKCINALLKSRSYLSYPVLDWLIQTSKSKNIVCLSSRIKKELKIAGLRKDISLVSYFSEKLNASKPLSFWFSPLDGNSNFSFVFARENKDESVSTFFTVLNIDEGPISCFGLSSISKNEFNTVLKRFFSGTEIIKPDKSFAVKLLNELTDRAYEKGYTVPYELLCWRQLTYDIEPMNFNVEEYIESFLTVKKVDNLDLKRLISSEFLSKWFYKYNASNDAFRSLIDEICLLSDNEFYKFESICETYCQNIYKGVIKSDLIDSLKKRILYQSYFLYLNRYGNLCNSLYSIGKNDKMLYDLFFIIIKKSVYEYFQNLLCVKNYADDKNIFARQKKIRHFDFDAASMVKLIEEKWTQ